MRSSMLPVALLVVAPCFLGAACQRTPEEPPAATHEPSTTTATNASTTSPMAKKAWGARCVHETPKDPPPPAPASTAACPKDPEPKMVPLPRSVSLSFPASGAHLDAELARTDDERQRGLMYRSSMAEDHGMLFRMAERDDHVFWMRNTCISLDMLFIEDDGLIAGIYENAPTLQDIHCSVGCPSSWVLETNAGWARRHGVLAGQTMPIPAEARRP